MTATDAIRETKFHTQDGVEIFEKTWGCQSPKALVIIAHGIAEHIERYAYVASQINAKGYAAVGWDLRGHGRSSGKRNYVHRFTKYLDELDQVLDRARASYPGLPIFLLGHSMGGGIAAYYAIDRQPDLSGVILSAASVKINEDLSPLLQKVSGFMSAIAPKLPTIKLDSQMISRDPQVVKDYDSDPLNYRGGILARTASELLKTTGIISEKVLDFSLPVLIIHGGSDQLTYPAGSEEFHDKISVKDKTLKIYPDLYHEILNEPERDEVIDDICSWIEARI